jgi:uncharacterized protein (DUF362 family)/ferredoxin
MKPMPQVSLVQCLNYDPERTRATVREALELLGGLGAYVREGQTVLLKPNLLSARPPEAAVTTHPAVVEAVAREVMAVGGRPMIGDSPPYQGHNAKRYESLCRVTGMSDVANRLGIEIVSLDHPWREVETGGKLFRRAPVASAFLEADVVINLPKLKTHGLTAFSGALKNTFGCVPGLKKSQLHLQAAEDPRIFQQLVVDVYRACVPTLNLMDAVVGMEGHGPSQGQPRQVGAILAGVDAVALDVVACELVGISPTSVATLRLAGEQGLGEARLEKIDIVGEELEAVRVPGFRPSPIGSGFSQIPKPILGPLKSQFVPMPHVRRRECIGCGDCVKVCAAGAMRVVPRRRNPARKVARADFKKCIACYCCDEACTYGAIGIRKGWLGELARRKA